MVGSPPCRSLIPRIRLELAATASDWSGVAELVTKKYHKTGHKAVTCNFLYDTISSFCRRANPHVEGWMFI